MIFNLGYCGSFSSNVSLERAAKYSVSCYQHVLVEKLSLSPSPLILCTGCCSCVCVCSCVRMLWTKSDVSCREGWWPSVERNKPDKYLFFLFGALSPFLLVELFIVIHWAKLLLLWGGLPVWGGFIFSNNLIYTNQSSASNPHNFKRIGSKRIFHCQSWSLINKEAVISKHRCVHLKQRNGCVNPVQLCISFLLCTHTIGEGKRRAHTQTLFELCSCVFIPSILAAVCLPGNTFNVCSPARLFFVQTVNDLARRLASIFKRNTKSAARSLREKHREKRRTAPWKKKAAATTTTTLVVSTVLIVTQASVGFQIFVFFFLLSFKSQSHPFDSVRVFLRLSSTSRQSAPACRPRISPSYTFCAFLTNSTC